MRLGLSSLLKMFFFFWGSMGKVMVEVKLDFGCFGGGYYALTPIENGKKWIFNRRRRV